MQVKCTSCGALQNINQAQNCDFCGNHIEIENAKNNFQSIIAKKKIKKCKIDDENSEIKHEGRSIENIQEIIDLYSDIEIDNTDTLTLKNNNLKSLKKISRFTVNDLDVSRNNIICIDELPSTSKRHFYYNFRYNSNLKDISEEVLSYINGKRDIRTVKLYFYGCDSFDVESLSKIDYSLILCEPCAYFGISFEIEPPLNAEMPVLLRELGFKIILSQYDLEGLYIKNENERDRYVWLLEKEKCLEHYSGKEKEGCFIATATMGNYDHPILIDLRFFRDNWLKKRSWGIKFIDWYYIYGSKAARVIEKSILLKMLSYIFLVKPLHLIIKKFKN